MSYSETKLQSYFSYLNNEEIKLVKNHSYGGGGGWGGREKANVNKGSVSKQSPEGKTINIRTVLQKSITITG